ncbi:MAG: hypothetical protein GY742_15095 [Hyphomicrobiales bacterium]|nr:hypothetical protein [Hyphomicrobiales bacterium]
MRKAVFGEPKQRNGVVPALARQECIERWIAPGKADGFDPIKRVLLPGSAIVPIVYPQNGK